MHKHGLIELGMAFCYKTKEEALAKCRALVRHKIRHDMMFEASDIPDVVRKKLMVPDIDTVISNDEFLSDVQIARKQRLVHFSDVSGIEEYYDAGVEYLAIINSDDDSFMKVYDRFGELRDCLVTRFSKIENSPGIRM